MLTVNGDIKAFFEALLDSVNDAVTAVDKEGTVLYWNEAAERMYGIPKRDIAGKRIGEFFRKESVMLFQVMESGSPARHVYHEPRPGMHVIIHALPVYNAGQELIGAISIEQDISGYVQMSEELYNRPADPDAPVSAAALPLVQAEAEALALAAKRQYPLLLAGEAGVGKRGIAEWLHRSAGKKGKFVAVSCGTVPGGLLETELFGLQGETFGDKLAERPGKLDLAAGGTLYLKDLHTISLPAQEKLAEAIGGSRFYRVGDTKPLPLACRIVASVPSPVERLVEDGALLPELYYAFQVQQVPALKDRKAELPELCRYFLAEAARKMGKPLPVLSPEALTAITTFDWPGNLPQLKHAMEHIVIAAREQEITSQDLPSSIRLTTLTNLTQQALPLNMLSEEVERTRIEEALGQTKGNKAGAARLLGISRGALYYKLKQYGLE